MTDIAACAAIDDATDATTADATESATMPDLTPATPTAALLLRLKAWSEQGWIRRLDSAFAGFMVELCPHADARVVLAAALVAQMEGRGHTCLLIDELLGDAGALLGWTAATTVELRAVLAELPPGLDTWLAALHASPLVAVDGPDGAIDVGDVGDVSDVSDGSDVRAQADLRDAGADEQPPLVLRGSKLYLRRHWDCERRVAAQVRQRSAAVAVAAVDHTAAARLWLDRLFPPAPGATGGIDWQKIACAVALRGRLSVITGGPGTGKTYTAARLLALLFAVDPEPQRLRVALAAPTGKAAARLKQSIDAALQALPTQFDGVGGAAESDPATAIATPDFRVLAARIGPARTLHSLLGARPDTRRFRADAAHPLALDVLIVDEASMIHQEMMAALLDALPAHARVVFLGDKDQLASVEAGAVLGDLCRGAESACYWPATAIYIDAVAGERLPVQSMGAGSALAQQTVMLRKSRRFGGPIGQLARAVNGGDVAASTAVLREGWTSAPMATSAATLDAPVHWLHAPTPAAVVRLALHGRAVGGNGGEGGEGGYSAYLDALAQRPIDADRPAFDAWVRRVLTAFERFRLLCAVREGEWGAVRLNQAVERALVADGRLVKRAEWYSGRPVMVTRNDAGIGVFNGDIGVVLAPYQARLARAAESTARMGSAFPKAAESAAPMSSAFSSASPLRAFFLDGDALRSVSVSRLANVETAFAMTVHKSQGSEFEHTVLVLPVEPSRVLTRELVYTGITRARQIFTLVSGRRQAFAEAITHRTRRSSGLLELLNSPAETPVLAISLGG